MEYPLEPQANKRSSLVIIAVSCAIFALLYAGYLKITQSRLEEDLVVATANRDAITSEKISLESAKLGELSAASKAVATLYEKQIHWSEALSLVIDATPSDIEYRSFSGNDNGSISINASAASFSRIGELIALLEQKPFISSVFVSNVTQSTSPSNASIYTFSLNVTYEK